MTPRKLHDAESRGACRVADAGSQYDLGQSKVRAGEGSQYDWGQSKVRAGEGARSSPPLPASGTRVRLDADEYHSKGPAHTASPQREASSAENGYQYQYQYDSMPHGPFCHKARSAPAGLPKTVEVGRRRRLTLGCRLLLHSACCHGTERRLQRRAASQSRLAAASASATTKTAATTRCS